MLPHHDTDALLVGLDDTDNLESCGTGFHARALGAAIEKNGWGVCRHITRHQLLVSPLVPYTSHNSAACVRVEGGVAYREAIEQFCIDYLRQQSAPGSDAGLCVAGEARVTVGVQRYGFLCKRRVATQEQASGLAAAHGIALHGLTGTRDGMIGALAAVGLHGSGSDGRLLWLHGLRELAERRLRADEVLGRTGVDVIQTVEGAVLGDPDAEIAMGPWPRAAWLGGQATLIIERNEEETGHGWRVASKNYLKQF